MNKIIPTWLQAQTWRQSWRQDMVAGVVVGIVVIPQSLGYALLAGLPPVYGLYASIIPVLVYAYIGASNTQAVGPVAITAIMSAQALAPFAQANSSLYLGLMAFMALLVGIMLVLAALLKLGWIMQFISRSVMAAFITGAALLIITGQLKYILGLNVQADTVWQLLWGFGQQYVHINYQALSMGLVAVLLLWLNRRYGTQLLQTLSVNSAVAILSVKLVPVLVIMAASSVVYYWQLTELKVVGEIQAGLPAFSWPDFPAWQQWQALLSAAFFIALIAYLKKEQLTVEWILETHAHADHLSAAHYLKQQVGGKIAIGEKITQVQSVFKKIFNLGEDFSCNGAQFDHLFADEEVFTIGDLQAKVMLVAGHTPADVAYLIEDAVFVGDTLFMPDVGTARCDFPQGDARTLYYSIQRILSLADETRLFMCHDYPPLSRSEYRYLSTVAEQKSLNIHLHSGISESYFVKMRQERDATLAMPRLIIPAIQVNIRAGEFPPAENNGVAYLKVPLNVLGKG